MFAPVIRNYLILTLKTKVTERQVKGYKDIPNKGTTISSIRRAMLKYMGFNIWDILRAGIKGKLWHKLQLRRFSKDEVLTMKKCGWKDETVKNGFWILQITRLDWELTWAILKKCQ